MCPRTFDNYWFFFPLFWLALGYGAAAVYVGAFRRDSLRWKMHYVGILCATHWLISQCFAEAFVPAMIYQGAYLLAFRIATVPAGGAPGAMPAES